MKSGITNKHLKKSVADITNFLSNHTEPPDDLIIEFLKELKVSNLLIPAVITGEEISFPHLLTDDGQNILPLFSDDEEFSIYSGDFEPVANDFEYYRNLVNDLNLAGILINCQSDEFFIDLHLINDIPLDPFKISDNFKGCGPDELRGIADNAKNDSFINFMNSSKGFEGLETELSRATLLNIVFSPQSLDEYSRDGIIRTGDVGGFNLCSTKVSNEAYGLLFTDLDKVKQICSEMEGHYYYQLTSLREFFEFVLKKDMDGAIVNMGSDDYFIPRNVILDIYENPSLDNPGFKRSVEYAFLL
jgi:hypothetical protein